LKKEATRNWGKNATSRGFRVLENKRRASKKEKERNFRI